MNNKFEYIIGDNGVGKSRHLEELASRQSQVKDVVVISSSYSDKFTYGKEKKKAKLESGSYTYKGNRTVGNGMHINALSGNAAIDYVEVLRKGHTTLFNNTLQYVGLDSEIYLIPKKDKRRKPDENLHVNLNKNGTLLDIKFANENSDFLSQKNKPYDLAFSKNGQLVLLKDLSSGEQNLVMLALKILSTLKDDISYYIDEPELSLHIQWQVKWPKLFRDLVNDFENVSATIATHSPVIISSASELGEDCFSMTRRDGGIEIVKNNGNMNNLNIESLIYKSFKTITQNNSAIYEECANILSEISDTINSPGEFNKNDIISELDDLKRYLNSLSGSDKTKEEAEEIIKDFDGAVASILSKVGESTQ